MPKIEMHQLHVNGIQAGFEGPGIGGRVSCDRLVLAGYAAQIVGLAGMCALLLLN